MRYLFFSLLILISTILFGNEIDSLNNLIKTKKGTEKASALIDLALKIKKKDKEKALQHANEAYNIASKSNNVEYIVKATNAKGSIYLSNNDLNKTDSLYKYSIEFSKNEEYTKGLMSTYGKMAKLYSRAAQYKQALAFADTSISYSNQLDEIKTLSATYLTVGNIHYYMGTRDSAIYYFEKSLALKQKLDDEAGASGVSMNIGIIAYQSGQYEKSLEYYNKALKSFRKLKDSLSLGLVIENIAITYYHQGKLDSSLIMNKQALNLYKKVNDKGRYASCLENLAQSYDALGNVTKAINLQLESIKTKEEIKDKRGLGYGYINLSSYHQKLKQYKKAIELVNKALTLFTEIEDKYNIARTHANLSGIYYSTKNYEKGIEEASISLEMNKELKNNNGIAGNYLTLGNIYNKKEEKQTALDYYIKSLEINEKIGDKIDIAGLQNNIGVIYYDLKQYNKAKDYYLKALEIRKEIGIKLGLVESYKTLANVYSKLNNYKTAFDYLYQYSNGKEELLNENITEQMNEMNAKYESEKKEQEIALLQKEGEIEKTKHEEETRRNNIIIYAGSGGALLLLILAFVLFKSNNQKKKSNQLLSAQNKEITKQRDEVEIQKLIVEEKNREITDSIQYAKRIQNAILPPNKVVKEYLQESFIYYKPKDIVAGDFYWLEQKNNKILFAAADCTGHGVPGAMVSVVCNNGLNRSVREYGLTDPGKILNKTREIVVQEFEKSEEEVKDGMDIAICSLEGNTLQYAGAHNPLWIIKKDAQEIEEIKANKQPIGQFDNPEPYTTHTIELQKGDSLYIFSDGYADQFGGEKGKKLKTANFKQLLISIQKESMEKQKQLIDEAFENWKGDLEQLDDVCVIGVKI